MRKIIALINRDDEFSKKDFVKNIFSATLVFFIIIYATKGTAFQTFEGTKAAVISSTMGCIWIGVCNTISRFFTERSFVIPRLKSGLITSFQYLTVTYVMYTILSVIQAIVATLLFSIYFQYGREGLIFSNTNIELFLTNFLIIEASTSLGIVLSFFINNIKSGIALLPVVFILQLLLSNSIFKIEEGFLSRFSNFVIASYGFEAIGTITNANKYPLAMLQDYPMITQTVDTLFLYEANHVLNCWISLLIFSVTMFFLSHLILEYMIYRRDK